MITLTYSKTDVDLVYQWMTAREAGKTSVRDSDGSNPNIPASIALKLVERIYSKRKL